VGTGLQAFAAAYAHVVVDSYDIPAAVIAVLGWTNRYAGVTVHTLLFVYVNNRG
jgi:hypothetical protein